MMNMDLFIVPLRKLVICSTWKTNVLYDVSFQIEVSLEIKNYNLQFRLSKLCLEYQQMISVVQILITADMVFSLELHLQDML